MTNGNNIQQTPPPPPNYPQYQSPNGVTILVLGIIGFFCLVTGIIAWVMGNKEIKLYPYDGNVKAGRICGIVSTIIQAVIIAIYLAVIIIILIAQGAWH